MTIIYYLLKMVMFILYYLYPNTNALCSDGVNLFQRNGQWQDMDYEPTAGAIIFFDWDGDGIIDHTGIVEKCENSTVYTIEGNSGDACRQRSYPVGSSVIYGYGIPAY